MNIMSQATFRFYEELNDFLPEENRKRDFEVPFSPTCRTGDVIASLGIPHEQIDLILVDGISVPLDHLLEGGERVSVYPVFESFDIRAVKYPGTSPLRHLTFVADGHLGKLARYMRLLGFDTLFDQSLDTHGLIETAVKEGRVFLTRSRRLLTDGRLIRTILVPGEDLKTQLTSVIQRLDLYEDMQAFSRCMICNARVKRVSKESVAHRLPPKVRLKQKTYFLCPSCNRIYWKGTHFKRMLRFVRQFGARSKIARSRDAQM